MISDWVEKYTCAHMNNAKAQTILVHIYVLRRPTPETCDNSVFKIG